MKKILFYVLFVAGLFVSISSQNALAQTEAPKLEVGAHYTVMRLRALSPLNSPVLNVVLPEYTVTDSGVGGRVTFNLTNHIAIEGEFNFFPEERVNFAEQLYLNSRRYQGLAGVKAGLRGDRVGVFGKARPGFMHFGEGTPDPRIQTLVPIPPTAKSTEFALDLGGVLEFYPSRHTVVRFDIGDTIIRYGRGTASGRPSNTTHNLQMSFGAGFRF